MKSQVACLMLLVALLIPGTKPVIAQDNVAPGAEPIDSSIDPATLKYDILVDGNLQQDDPAARKFSTVQAAYAAAGEGTGQKPTVIGIMPNVYHIGGSMERVPSLGITKNWITFLGLTKNRRAVVLADNRGLDEGASDDGYILDVNATGFCARNLTILNYCNCDYEYPGDASKNLTMRNPTITQAVALQAAGDKHVYENVALLSRLDTMFLRTARSYFKNVYIEGTDDWMGGGQMSVWQDCELLYPRGQGVMSASNVVFFHCKFDAVRGMEFYKAEFGGAARPDALIDCQVPGPPSRLAWVRGIGLPRTNQYSLVHNNKDANGNPVVFNDDTTGHVAFTSYRQLSDRELSAYNPWNLLRAPGNGEPDDWDPAHAREKYEKAGKQVYRIALRVGEPRTAADGGAPISAFRGPATPTPTIRTGGAGVKIAASVLPRDADDKTITWSSKSNLVALSTTSGPEVVVSGTNATEEAQYVPITAMAADGFYVTAWVYVEPKFVDPPAVTSAVKLNAPVEGKVNVDYGLDLTGRADRSLVSWYACDDASGANAKKIAVSRGDQPLKSYTLMPGDVGKFLRVGVEPKLAISESGKAVFASASAPIAAGDVPSPTVAADFRNFVETPSDGLIAGRWTVEGPWMVLSGDNLVNGYGIRAGTGGRGSGDNSRLLYFRDAEAGDMQVDLVITPDKTEGTVFAVSGSPSETGPRNDHGDFYVKYDPRTKTGYSLRYWRTTKSAAACTYQFYKIENGAGSPLSDTQVQSGVFKRNTIITLKVSGSTISVEAHNTADDQKLSMQDTIVPNRFSGAGIFASGAASVYSEFKVSYP